MSDFSQLVTATLQDRNMTQSDLARLMKRTPQYISQILAKDRRPTANVVTMIAEALDVPPETLDPQHQRHTRFLKQSSLTVMSGIEVAYLEASMGALQKARDALLKCAPGYALSGAAGKPDTYMFDAIAENTIVHHLISFNDKCAIFTEERSDARRGRVHARTLSYFLDPFDRSKIFARALNEAQSRHKTIRELVGDPGFRMEDVNAPFGSITCVRDSHVLFNAMLDYSSGEVFVACKGMTKHGNIDECPDPRTLDQEGDEILFDPQREGNTCVCYVGTDDSLEAQSKSEKYKAIFRDLKFDVEQLPADPSKRAPGGPARILFLAQDEQLADESKPAFILSNGERICEWIGWLAYALYAKRKDLVVFELFTESVQFLDDILLAPPPSYSVFSYFDEVSDKTPSSFGEDVHPFHLNLDRLTVLKRPDMYRGAIAVAHIESPYVATLRAMQNSRELLPHRRF